MRRKPMSRRSKSGKPKIEATGGSVVLSQYSTNLPRYLPSQSVMDALRRSFFVVLILRLWLRCLGEWG